MKELKLMLVVEVIRKDEDVTETELIESVGDLICKSGRYGGRLAFTIKEVLPLETIRVYNKKFFDDDCEVMTIKDWEFSVENGWFGIFDGCGYWVKDGMACKDEVFNSEPQDATHVVWYNK